MAQLDPMARPAATQAQSQSVLAAVGRPHPLGIGAAYVRPGRPAVTKPNTQRVCATITSKLRLTTRSAVLLVEREQQLQDLQLEESTMVMHAEDVRYATLLSELVYRAAECRTEDSFAAHITALESELGASLPNIRHHKTGGQRYLVGESDAAIYVAFQGTRTPTDWLANLAFFHGPFWHHKQHQQQQHQHHHYTSSSSSSSSSSTDSSSKRARAHGGFIRRANHAAMSIDALHAAAAAAGKRLVLTGHSLGGAVATLTTVRLLRALALQQQQAVPDPSIRCISFAAPAVANTDLLQEVAAAGWDQFITNIILPEDPVVPFVNLLLKAPTAASSSSSKSKLNRQTISNSSSSSSEASSRIMAGLHRSDSSNSVASLPSRSGSWDSLSDLTSYTAQQQALAMQGAVAAEWDFDLYTQQQVQAAQQVYVHAAAGCTSSYAQAASGGSAELASWLTAARGAVQRQRIQRRAQLHRSLSNASEAHSASSDSLTSLSAASDSSGSSSSNSLAVFTSGLEGTLLAASAAASQWMNASSQALSNSSSGSSSSSMQHNTFPNSSKTSKRWSKVALARAGMTAFVTGALAAGVRCSAALAAPQLLGPQLSLFGMLPAALTAPVALAAMHIIGKAALPVSHPLGQQYVMTGAGLEPVDRPLKSYPRSGEGLDLKQLGGLFPGHRMIAYRRRMVKLLQQGTWEQ